jgi:hypothetical protein
MKNLFIIFFLLSTRLVGQSHQQDIIKFVDDNLGKKIGTGLCYELVQEAIRTYNPEYNGTSADKNKYGKKIKKENAQVGDIIVLSGGTKHVANHVCIVYKIDGEDIYVAEQNTNGNLKKSVVEVNLLNYEWDTEYFGKVRYDFYHQ